MGLLPQLSSALQGAVAWTFSEAQIVTEGAQVSNGKGGFTAAEVVSPCMAKLDKKESRDGSGGIVRVTRILILAGSLTVEPKRGNVIRGLGGKTYKLGKCDGDGIASHWVCEVADG